MAKCGLCKLERKLFSSHLLPAAIYKLLRAEDAKDPNPVVISGDRARTTSEQVQKPFLCSRCEQRFNANGERVVAGQCARIDHFPLRERLKNVPPLLADDRLAAFADSDAADNYRVVLGFRDQLADSGTLEGAYLAMMRSGRIRSELMTRSRMLTWPVPSGSVGAVSSRTT